MTVTFDLRRAMVMTPHTQTQVERSVGSKDRTDRRTLPIALPSS